MRELLISAFLVHSFLSPFAQTSSELINTVHQSQRRLVRASYDLIRKDTLVTGTVRTITGTVKLTVLPTDTIFGFKFWAKKDGVNHESIYDGNSSFDVDHDNHQYSSSSNPEWLPHFLDNYGGQVVLTDLVKLDTTNVLRYELKQDADHYYLLMHLPDLTRYKVIKRTRTITINKTLMLPVGVVFRQETLGKIQALNYRIKNIQVNDAAVVYDFSGKRYPLGYKVEKGEINRKLFALQEKPAPYLSLNSFSGANISSDQFKGKLVLLDFWEVWCGPCIESMPKVQEIYKKYKDKGLLVYGVTHEKEVLDVAKRLIKEKDIRFPMLIGNIKSKQEFSIQAVPVYILIGKDGKILMVSEGYPADLEESIQKYL